MSARIKIAAGAVLVVVLIVIAVVLLSGGDDDDAAKPGTPAARSGGAVGGDEQPDSGSQPTLRTVMTKRASGQHATLAAGAILTAPREVWLRVSAAPKQEVSGNWNITCGKLGTSMDTFVVTPPSIQQLELPGKNAKSCVVGTSAQLKGKGRLKVAVLRDR
jgi:hypothetical protein